VERDGHMVAMPAMRALRRVFATAITCVAVLALTVGCAAAELPSRSELIGTWENVHDGASISLLSNGTAIVKDVPEQAIDTGQVPLGGRPGGTLISSIGTWTRGNSLHPARDNAGVPVVYVLMPDVGPGGFDWQIEVLGSGNHLRLSVVLGDPDNNNSYEFLRKA